MAFAVAAAVMALALWRVARTPAGFALGVAALFLAFFVLNKQAFANYYFFVVGALVRGGGGDGPVGGGPAARPSRGGDCTAGGPRRTRKWRADGGQRRTISTVKPAISSRR